MKKLILILSAIFVTGTLITALHGQIIVGNYTATSFQSGAALPASCSGSAIFTLTTTWAPYYCNNGTYTLFSNGGSSLTSANLLNGSVGALPYQTAVSTTAFVYPTTDSQMIYLDGNRTDYYIPDGTFERPYKTLDQLGSGLTSYISGGGTGPIAIWASPNSAYSTAIAFTFPAIATTIFANNSTWTFSAGVTVNAVPMTIYDLNTVGNVTYSTCSSTTRSERHGGSYSGGNVTLGIGCYNHQYGVNLSGSSYIFTVNGLLYAEATTGSMTFASGGPNAFIALYNTNMAKATNSTMYNVDMTLGGRTLISGGIMAAGKSTVANVYLPLANTTTTAHAISGVAFTTGLGVLCTNGLTTYVAMGQLLGAATYCTLPATYTGPINIMGQTIGAQTIYRCTTAGTVLPVGSLTTVAANCGASTAIGLTVQ
jgi:hypothetical protein